MRRLLYIILAFVLAACSQEIFPEDALILPDYPNSTSEIAPAASICPADLPPAATRAMVDISTITSMEANVLKIDEDRDGNDNGLYTFGSWESAYLAESSISSPASASNGSFRTMILNPVQAYSYKVDEGTTDTTFYHTRMISWYPRTATLHKNDEGKASVMRFSDFEAVNQSVYDTKDDRVVLNFKDLDGTKDVMVSNIVEGQHWHSFDGSETYTYPFGHNDSSPKYSNVMTYKHYLAAVKIYAYALDSDQVVSMWGALRSVMVRNQPSQVSVTLPNPGDMEDATIENNVQNNALEYGPATFSGKVDFPLVKTAMYAADTDDPKDPGIAEDSPHLVQDKRIYLGYALVKPWTEDSPNLELDVHTDAGVLSLSVPMKQTVDVKEGETVVGTKEVTIQAGFIYHIDVNFNTEGAVADIVLQSDDDHYYDLSAGMELADGIHDYKYANCYVVHPEIKRYLDANQTVYDYYDGYAFLATKVGSATAKIYPEFASDRTTKDIDPVRAGLLWETSPGLVTQVELLYGYIRFKVQPPEIKEGNNWVNNELYREGNAVIAAYDSQRKVLWSWHIWVTDKPEDVIFGTGNTAITLLDRNLGATASDASTTASDDTDGHLLETYGLYYQWGRKDPSMGPEVANYLPQSTETAPYYDYYGMKWDYAGVVTKDRPGIRDGVENPMYLVLPTDFSMTTYQYDWMYTNIDNLWGDYLEKTIYDPCPFDYMVPQDEISTLFATTSHTYKEGRGMYINGSLFPFAGYKGVDKGVSSLSGAWKYVGAKGDYMSAKIEQNGHRSRTYISDDSSWVEYGADADNDGDGDASRSYSSIINADDMANRRTAASVRCVKMNYGAKGSVSASFVGDKSYSFIADASIGYVPEPINFTYKINTIGENVTISMAHIDAYNGDKRLDDYFYSVPIAAGQTNYSGKWTTEIPDKVETGVVRYRLVANASNGVVSRISYTLRLFDIAALKIGGVAYSSETTVTPGQTYDVSFSLKGLESDFTVLVNGAVAKRGTVAAGEMPYTVSGIGIPGHLHIQIIDADGNLACEKSYSVKQSSNIQVTYTVDAANKISDARKLEAGKPYYFRRNVTDDSKFHVICYDSSTEKLGWAVCPINSTIQDLGQATESKVVDAEYVFYYHRDDTKIYNLSYNKKSAGALFNPAADDFLKEDFTFGPDSEAVYVTIANPSNNSSNVQLYSSVTGDQLYYYTYGNNYDWGWYAPAYPSKWDIYPVIVTAN